MVLLYLLLLLTFVRLLKISDIHKQYRCQKRTVWYSASYSSQCTMFIHNYCAHFSLIQKVLYVLQFPYLSTLLSMQHLTKDLSEIHIYIICLFVPPSFRHLKRMLYRLWIDNVHLISYWESQLVRKSIFLSFFSQFVWVVRDTGLIFRGFCLSSLCSDYTLYSNFLFLESFWKVRSNGGLSCSAYSLRI